MPLQSWVVVVEDVVGRWVDKVHVDVGAVWSQDPTARTVVEGILRRHEPVHFHVEPCLRLKQLNQLLLPEFQAGLVFSFAEIIDFY